MKGSGANRFDLMRHTTTGTYGILITRALAKYWSE